MLLGAIQRPCEIDQSLDRGHVRRGRNVRVVDARRQIDEVAVAAAALTGVEEPETVADVREGQAVRTARASDERPAHRRREIPKELLLEVAREGDVVTGLIEGARHGRVLPVEYGRSVEVGAGRRIVHVPMVVSVGVGVTEREVARSAGREETRIEILLQDHRGDMRAVVACVGQQVLATVRVPRRVTLRGDVRVSRGRVETDEGRVAAGQQGIDRPIDGTPVDREPAEARRYVDRLRQIRDRERIMILAVDIVEVQVPAAGERACAELEVRLVSDVRTIHGRQLDVGIDSLGEPVAGRGKRRGVVDHALRNTREIPARIDHVQRAGRARRRNAPARAPALTRAKALAVVLEDVAEPDERIAAGEDSNAPLHPASTDDAEVRQVIGEAEARQQHRVDGVEARVVTDAVTVEEDRVEFRVIAVEPVEARARDKLQIIVHAPVVLCVNRVNGAFERRCRVVDVAAGRAVDERTCRRTAPKDRVWRWIAGARPIGEDAALQVCQAAKDQSAGGLLHEEVEDARMVKLEAGLQLVVARVEIGDALELVELRPEIVRRA